MTVSTEQCWRTAQPPCLVVVVRVNSNCSVGCRFCGFSRDLHYPRQSIDFAKLSALGKTLQEHQEETGQPVLVAWLGGEPYQWPELKTATQLYVNEYGLRLGITTNGMALSNDSLRHFTLEYFDQITISVDGLETYHDWVRQRTGMFQQLQRITRQLRSERMVGRTLMRVNTVLTRGNIAQFPEFCEAMQDWGFDELTLNQLGGNDRPEFYAEHHLLPLQVEQLIDQLPTLKTELETRGLRIQASEAYLSRIRATTHGIKLPKACCSPGEKFLFVDEHGRIAPCSFTSHILSQSITSTAPIVQELPQWFQTMKSIRRPVSCLDCHATHVYQKFGSEMNAFRHTD